MKKLKIFLLILIGVPALLILSIFIRNKSVGPEGWIRDDLISSLENTVKNPDSLVIKQEKIFRKPNGSTTKVAICGIADAKNSFGSYTGGFRFVATGSYDDKSYSFNGVNIESDDEIRIAKSINVKTPFEKVYWDDYCK